MTAAADLGGDTSFSSMDGAAGWAFRVVTVGGAAARGRVAPGGEPGSSPAPCSRPVLPSSPDVGAAAARGVSAGADPAAEGAADSSSCVALLVARSTVTLRTASSGPAATGAGAITRRFGPDNNSGTI